MTHRLKACILSRVLIGALLATLSLVQFEPLDAIYVDMPSELVRVSERIRTNSEGVSDRIARVFRSDNRREALAVLRGELPGWLQGTYEAGGNLIQASTGSESQTQWYGITIFKASIVEIEAGEEEQGSVHNKTSWKNGERSLEIHTIWSNAVLTQVRRQNPQGGGHLQRSSYWTFDKNYGSGIDWLIPIATDEGVHGYVVLSIYNDPNHSSQSAKKNQLSAVEDWMDESEDS